MITVQLNEKHIKQWLDDIAQRQIPFATAKALTDTAARIGQEAASRTAITMNIRSSWAAKYRTSRIGQAPNQSTAYTASPADKRSGLNNMQSAVGTIGWQMAQQIDDKDTIRRPHKAKSLWIPLNVKRTRSNSPARMLKKKGVFIQKTSKGPIMFQRKGQQITPIYLMRKKQTIKPRFNFLDMANQRAGRYFNVFFNRAMAMAIRTAKR